MDQDRKGRRSDPTVLDAVVKGLGRTLRDTQRLLHRKASELRGAEMLIRAAMAQLYPQGYPSTMYLPAGRVEAKDAQDIRHEHISALIVAINAGEDTLRHVLLHRVLAEVSVQQYAVRHERRPAGLHQAIRRSTTVSDIGSDEELLPLQAVG